MQIEIWIKNTIGKITEDCYACINASMAGYGLHPKSVGNSVVFEGFINKKAMPCILNTANSICGNIETYIMQS